MGACQLLAAWTLVVATQQAAPGRSLTMFGVGSVVAVAVGFLHGALLVKPLALLGRLTARLTAWPQSVAVLVLMVPLSAPPAAAVRWWLRQTVAATPSFGAVWAGTAACAVLPLAAGAALRARAVPVPAKTLWARALTVTAAAVAVTTMAGFVMELPV
ncbi:hypothetical protein AB0953_35090 [Streptomyces sp. NPDC046866]|uniref:hypothetical protein n=1 Tax=Streptomyces sp. NPDC046866 TaxID=3154921 RepID=UPI0034547F27